MKKLIHLTLVVFFLSLIGCEDDNKSVIEGQFYKDCSLAPIEPITLKIYGTKPGFLKYIEDEYLGEVRTNETGNFRFEYEYSPRIGGYKFYNGSKYFFATSFEKKKKFIAFDRVVVNHNIKLLVSRPFNDQDTLYFAARANGTVITLPGPFTDGQIIPISIVPNIGTSSGLKYEDFREGEGVFWWGLGNEEFQKVWFNPAYQIPPNTIERIYQNVCGQGGEIVVDMRNK